MQLLDVYEQRWYCYKDDQLFYATENRWDERVTAQPTVSTQFGSDFVDLFASLTCTANSVRNAVLRVDNQICSNCGNSLATGWKFCKECGTKVTTPTTKPDALSRTTMFCNECGAKIPGDSIFCEECGNNLVNE
jgi:predicted amidophosphoribosyltransferase